MPLLIDEELPLPIDEELPLPLVEPPELPPSLELPEPLLEVRERDRFADFLCELPLPSSTTTSRCPGGVGPEPEPVEPVLPEVCASAHAGAESDRDRAGKKVWWIIIREIP